MVADEYYKLPVLKQFFILTNTFPAHRGEGLDISLKRPREVLKNKGIVLVDFYAQWCGPCKMTGPIIEQLAEEVNNVKFVKVDVDQNQELSSQYQVFSIPTFLIFKDGQVVNQFVGALGKEGFLSEINKVTQSSS